MLVEATPAQPNAHMQFKSVSVISLYNFDGSFLSGNTDFIKAFGDNTASLASLFNEEDTLKKVLKSISQKIPFEIDALLKTAHGNKWFRMIVHLVDHSDEDNHILINHFDIHDSKIMEQDLQLQAWADPLTGLVNRRGLSNRLEHMINEQSSFSMLYLDLDGFKMVNYSLGHLEGDSILLEVTKRLKINCLNEDILSRFGGDEFIFIITNNLNKAELSARCKTIIDSISQPYLNEHGRNILLSASVGISHYPNDDQTYESMIACSDAAMYQAKTQGKKQYVHYQTGMEHLQKRMSVLAQKLSFAIHNNELSLHYQPIINYSTKKIVSFEALLRWHNDELGYISPEEAINVAEKVG